LPPGRGLQQRRATGGSLVLSFRSARAVVIPGAPATANAAIVFTHLRQHAEGERSRPADLPRLPPGGTGRWPLRRPPPFVAGHGLQDLQQAVALQLKRVSAAKVVVTLAEPGKRRAQRVSPIRSDGLQFSTERPALTPDLFKVYNNWAFESLLSARLQFLTNSLRKARVSMPEIHRFGRAGVPILIVSLCPQ